MYKVDLDCQNPETANNNTWACIKDSNISDWIRKNFVDMAQKLYLTDKFYRVDNTFEPYTEINKDWQEILTSI